jgi:hypothetical protein
MILRSSFTQSEGQSPLLTCKRISLKRDLVSLPYSCWSWFKNNILMLFNDRKSILFLIKITILHQEMIITPKHLQLHVLVNLFFSIFHEVLHEMTLLLVLRDMIGINWLSPYCWIRKSLRTVLRLGLLGFEFGCRVAFDIAIFVIVGKVVGVLPEVLILLLGAIAKLVFTTRVDYVLKQGRWAKEYYFHLTIYVFRFVIFGFLETHKKRRPITDLKSTVFFFLFR